MGESVGTGEAQGLAVGVPEEAQKQVQEAHDARPQMVQEMRLGRTGDMGKGQREAWMGGREAAERG